MQLRLQGRAYPWTLVLVINVNRNRWLIDPTSTGQPLHTSRAEMRAASKSTDQVSLVFASLTCYMDGPRRLVISLIVEIEHRGIYRYSEIVFRIECDL